MASILLNNGVKIKCKDLSKVEYEKFIMDSVGGVVEELKEKYGVYTHQLKDGHVIVREKDYYTLYYSLEDLKKVLLNASEFSQGNEVMRNINTFKSRFPEETDALIKQLCSDLDMNYRYPDVDFLREIDAKIGESHNYESFNENHLINFIALIGEIIIKKYHGKWDMQLANDGQTWNPYLSINNQQLQFFTYLYEDIFINPPGDRHVLFSVYETADDIAKYNLGAMSK